MQAFVTVGSTKFDGLIDAIVSEDFLTRLSSSGYTRLVVQYGNSKLRQPLRNETIHDVEVIAWPFKPNLGEEYLAADLIISHAGLGEVCARFRSLTAHARFWNHFGSAEIKQTIDCRGERDFAAQSPERARRSSFCPRASCLVHRQASPPRFSARKPSHFCSELPRALETIATKKLTPFPPLDGNKFARILDEEMGFI